MTDEQESKDTQSERDRALEDDAKMSILAAVEATHGNPPGSGTVLDDAELNVDQVPLDINTAAIYQLANIPGIGPALARAIVDYRENVHRFEEASDITAVPGMSLDTYERIAGSIWVEPAEEDRPLVVGYDEPAPDVEGESGDTAEPLPATPQQRNDH